MFEQLLIVEYFVSSILDKYLHPHNVLLSSFCKDILKQFMYVYYYAQGNDAHFNSLCENIQYCNLNCIIIIRLEQRSKES